MKVGYFSNQFASASGHGIARYSRELYHAVRSLNSSLDLVPIAAWSDMVPDELTSLKNSTGLRILKTGRRLTPILWSLFNQPKIESLVDINIDILHVTSLGYPIASDLPTVMTIHDIGPLSHPEYFPLRNHGIMRRSISHALKNVDHFVGVSEFTATAFAHYVAKEFEQDVSSKLSVVYEGVSKDFISFDAKSNYRPICGDKPFILAAGKLSPRKNITGIVNALSRLKDQIDLDLVVVGGSGWDMESFDQLINDKGLAGRVHLAGYVSDEELKELYSKAEMFIYPSMFEGFGLTVLEAMACGTPVITSNSTSIPEVTGDAAILIDPNSTEELCDSILSLIHDPILKNTLVEKGKIRAQEMNWESAAQQMTKIYCKLK